MSAAAARAARKRKQPRRRGRPRLAIAVRPPASAPRPNVGSPFPIDHGASTRILWRRDFYGGRKGRAARLRLRALEKRIARSGVGRALYAFAFEMARLNELLFGIRTTIASAVDRAARSFA